MTNIYLCKKLLPYVGSLLSTNFCDHLASRLYEHFYILILPQPVQFTIPLAKILESYCSIHRFRPFLKYLFRAVSQISIPSSQGRYSKYLAPIITRDMGWLTVLCVPAECQLTSLHLLDPQDLLISYSALIFSVADFVCEKYFVLVCYLSPLLLV